MDRRTKIVCTIGPACRSQKKLVELIEAGMDVARLHFSYADQAEHAENIKRLRKAERLTGRNIAILQDLSGSKVRLRDFTHDSVELLEGEDFTLTGRKVKGTAKHASINFPELIGVVEPGDTVLLNDGALKLKVLRQTDANLHCQVTQGGQVKSQQAVHVLGKAAPVRVPTAKDLEDVRFGLRQGVDWIAQSFATNANEINSLRHFIKEHGASTPIIAKIERLEALKVLDEITEAADAVMVARGDLGLEIPLERIALVQKDIIHRANAAGKPAITATEMLFSMMKSPRPTRADISDITNAVLDGTDAVMLSGETGMGKFPIEATQMMARIVAVAEEAALQKRLQVENFQNYVFTKEVIKL